MIPESLLTAHWPDDCPFFFVEEKYRRFGMPKSLGAINLDLDVTSEKDWKFIRPIAAAVAIAWHERQAWLAAEQKNGYDRVYDVEQFNLWFNKMQQSQKSAAAWRDYLDTLWPESTNG